MTKYTLYSTLKLVHFIHDSKSNESDLIAACAVDLAHVTYQRIQH